MTDAPTRLRKRFSRALAGAVSVGLAVGAAVVLTSCGATTYDESIATTTTDIATTSTIPSGSTQELLRSLSTAMNGLSGLIGPDSSGRTPPGKAERILTIEALWTAVQPDVMAADPDAADAIGRMVALAQTAVDRNRPADADKAARFAGQVIESFLSAN